MAKTLFQREACTEIIARVEKLQPSAQRQWGKMDVAQMLAHCNESFEVSNDRKQLKRLFIGRILGAWAKKDFLSDKPLKHNTPTHPTFIVVDKKDFDTEKQKLIELINEFHEGGEAKCTSQDHSFFGKMTKAEWALLMYKHLDHHLSQFGA